MSSPNREFWRGRRVLLAGHTGFKGAWAALWLKHAGAEVTGLSLPPEKGPTLFDLAGVAGDVDHRIADLRDPVAVAEIAAAVKPEIVIHMAAQAIVRRAAREPLATFATNALGTAHLLEALREVAGVRAILVVTTDKVYENSEGARRFTETDPLGGHEPYSASKAAAELVTRAYAETFFASRGVRVAAARGGNVIGGGDFGEDRLVPDLVRAVGRDEPVLIRNPDSTRPWQHVLDCLAGYFRYAEALAAGAEVPPALNFGPASARTSVRALAEAMLTALDSKAGWRRDAVVGPREASELALDSSAARRVLNWREVLAAEAAVTWTADWYRAFRRGEDMRAATLKQIADYERLAVAEAEGRRERAL